MEKKKYNITVGNETKEFEEGTTYQAVAKEFCGSFSHPAVLAVEGENRLQELRKTVEKDCELKFITTADAIGHETYKRSLCFLLVKAVHDVAGHDKIERVRIHFSVDKGYYCTVDGDIKITEQFLADVAKRMRWLSDEKIPIKKKTIHTDDAIELFHRHGMYDKEKLFEYRRVSKVNIYSINEFEDYYYGYMVPDTGYLKYFSLHLYDEGFVIQMPVKEQPEKIPEFRPSPKLFHVLKESVLWGDCQDIETVGALNEMVTKGDMREVVLVQEAYQERRIGEIARQIADRKDVRFVLIAGPSSSGKTTFSHRLSIQLRVNGLKPHPIAVDNYFVDREHTPKDSDGNYDFECLEAIDIPKFNEDMRALLKGEEVYLPIFDFKSGKRKYESKPKKLGSQDILVIEGIHCLNPKLTETMADAMIEEAQVQTTELVSEHEIMQQAYAQANEIVTQATAQAQEIIDNATSDANAIRIGAIQYTDDLMANAESIIGHTLDSYTTKYDGLISSLQECYETVRANRAELDIPTEEESGIYNSQDDLF